MASSEDILVPFLPCRKTEEDLIADTRERSDSVEPIRTPLYDEHVRCGGKIVEFGGYLLPVQYETGVIQEHMAVRNACGLFDVSHMGEILVQGPDALKNLNHLLTNDYTVMQDGQARYSPMCYEDGGTVDDLIVYKVHDEDYFVVVNASNKDKDFQWMKEHCIGDAVIRDVSSEYGQIALQGPKAEEILRKLTPEECVPGKYYTARFDAVVGGIPCILSRTGYTGENGFELYLPAAETARMWRMLLDAGQQYGLIPCGLGARDTLRLEASMPLYGHELSEKISPVESGLGMFVKLNKPEFIGHDALAAAGQGKRRRVGLKVTGKGIVREHQEIYQGDRLVGMTTSGTFAPYLGFPVAMALLDRETEEIPGTLEVAVRGRRVAVETVPMPFYSRKRRG